MVLPVAENFGDYHSDMQLTADREFRSAIWCYGPATPCPVLTQALSTGVPAGPYPVLTDHTRIPDVQRYG
eukprot:3170587-Rhodomonas_salina.1